MSKATKQTTWDDLLMPWAKRFAELETDVQAHCVSLSDDELAELRVAASQPTETNCWWAVYDVAGIVRHEAAQEARRRGLTA